MLLFAVVGGLTLTSAGPARSQIAEGETRLLTDVLTVALDEIGDLDVLSSADVQQAVTLEADKQAVGCSASDCLAELAGAMGARLVVFGQVGQLGDGYLLTINLFDSERASSVGRVSVDAATVGELRTKLKAAAADLVAKADLPARVEGAEGTRVLVLDLVRTDIDVAPPAPAAEPEPEGAPVLLIVGGATAAVGLAIASGGAIAGVVAQVEHGRASDASLKQAEAIAAYDSRDTFSLASIILVAGGVVVIGAGVAIVVVDLIIGAE